MSVSDEYMLYVVWVFVCSFSIVCGVVVSGGGGGGGGCDGVPQCVRAKAAALPSAPGHPQREGVWCKPPACARA